MKVEKNLVWLGFVKSILWKDFKGQKNHETWTLTKSLYGKSDKRRAGMFLTDDALTLYIMPWVNPKILKLSTGMEIQKNLYRRWADRPASEAISIYLPANITKLEHVGYIDEIDYTSDKFDRPSDVGDYHLYNHQYKTRPAVFVNCPIKPYMWGISDPDGRKLMNYRGLIL